MTLESILLFTLAGLLLNLTPGPDVLYVVSNALRNGARAGVVAALGITAGCFVHIVGGDRGAERLAGCLQHGVCTAQVGGGGLPGVRGGRDC